MENTEPKKGKAITLGKVCTWVLSIAFLCVLVEYEEDMSLSEKQKSHER